MRTRLVLAVVLLAGLSWAGWEVGNVGVPERLRAVCFPTGPDTGFATGRTSTGRVFKTTDAAQTWSPLSYQFTYTLYTMHFPVDNMTGYVAGDAGGAAAYKTTDGGATWTRNENGLSQPVRCIRFVGGVDVGYAVGGAGTIARTTDGGATWTAQTSGVGDDLLSVCFPVDADTGYVVGDSGWVLKTTNGGADWLPQNSGTINPLRTVAFAGNCRTGFAGGSYAAIRTTDGGATWLPEFLPSPWLTAAQFCGPDTGFVVGEAGAVAMSVDGGETWRTQASGIVSDLHSVHFTDALNGYACGDAGVVLKTTDGGASWVAEERPVPPVGGRLSATVVRGVLFLAEATSREPQASSLLDISGREVVKLHTGANDVGGLAPGVYFVREQGGGRREQPGICIHKVMILR